MSPEDLADLFAFIMTLAAGRRAARPITICRFPTTSAAASAVEARLSGRAGLRARSVEIRELNRGAYLVNGPGHCAECHSERNAAGAIIEDRRFAGGPDPEGKGTVPNITPHPTGIGGWTAETSRPC